MVLLSLSKQKCINVKLLPAQRTDEEETGKEMSETERREWDEEQKVFVVSFTVK